MFHFVANDGIEPLKLVSGLMQHHPSPALASSSSLKVRDRVHQLMEIQPVLPALQTELL